MNWRSATAALILGGIVVVGCAQSAPPAADNDPGGDGPAATYATDPSTWGEVRIDAASVNAPGVPDTDRDAVLAVIERHHRAWLAQDTQALREITAKDAVRVDGMSGLSQGVDRIEAALPVEWEEWERPYGTIAMSFEIHDAELDLRQDIVTAIYEIDVHGGARWVFDGSYVCLDVYQRADAGWKLLHHAAADGSRTGLPDATRDLPQMDFVYPASDLERAVSYYEPLLGRPDRAESERVSYNLGAARFHVDTRDLGGAVRPDTGSPNGYAEFTVANLESEIIRLRAARVPVRRIEEVNQGKAPALIQDPDGNLLVLREFARVEDSAVPPSLRIESARGPSRGIHQAIESLWRAWLEMNPEHVSIQMSPRGRWIFETEGPPPGRDQDEAQTLEEQLATGWGSYDRGPQGLAIELTVAAPVVQVLPGWAIASHEYLISGLDRSRFEDRGVATHLLEQRGSGWTIAASLILKIDPPDEEVVLELDYTGYPVVRLSRSEPFYTETLRLGSPYQDVSYRGWWTRDSVFGIYRVGNLSPELIRSGRSNGYASFWVRSVDQVYEYLSVRGSTFPVIPAINNQAGIDHQPGYIQLVTLDSEGNVVMLSEYPGD